MKILVIDDSEDDRLLYRRAIKQNAEASYEIVEADDGETGFNLIQQESPECILLDYSLPGRNGIEVLKRIRSLHPFIPVVMMTGQGNEAIAVTAIQEGAQNYITKSTITSETIQRVIRVAIEHCALERRIYEQRTALEIFTRALAHDLKEPVRTIKSFLDLMAARETLSEKGKVYFNYIQNAAIRMDRLIDTVYFYTRLDGTSQHIAQELCDVGAVLQEAKENITQLIRERNATISSDALPQVYANRMQLLQMLQNLLINAIRHSDTQPAIHLSAVENNDQWVFTVADNGPGVDEGYREQIFEPFKRMSREKEQGLGLGLAICKKIVESYGGKIWYEASAGRGANFIFTLPKAVPETAKLPDAYQASPRIKDSPGKMIANIMLVEDNEADIELTKVMLIEENSLKCNLLIAHNGFEALDILHSEKAKTGIVDLILLDINMPGMDGFELLEKMRGDDSLQNIPVVMCTTSTYDKDIDKAKSLGAVGYLNKPAGVEKLKSIIDRVSGIHLQRNDGGYVLLRGA